MNKTPQYDQKVKTILDATQPGERICAITGDKWMMDEEEISWYKKFNVPPSTYSPLTRMRVVTHTFSGGQWWYNKHAETGKPIICGIHPATGIKVLPDKEWFEKDFISEARDYNLNESIVDQLYDLRLAVPSSAYRDYIPSENSITIASHGDVNSYFMVASQSKNSFHSVVAFNTENSSEVYNSVGVQDSYNIIHSDKIHNGKFIRECRECMNSSFLFDCRNCEKCFGATNKRNKKYLFWNEQLSEEEWNKRVSEIDLGSRKVMNECREKFDVLVRKAVWPENFNEKSENCIGDYMTNCKDCKYIYYGTDGSQNNYWCAWAMERAEGNAFVAEPAASTNTYYSSALEKCYNCLFCYWVARCQNSEFLIDSLDCDYCFACVGLRKKKYCIFNKQYSEDEYWQKVDELKCAMLECGEYGEFLPAKFNPGYPPECGSVHYYLAPPEFIKQVNSLEFDPESEGAIGEELINASDVKDVSELPDHARDLDGWAGAALYDPAFKRRFSLLKPEVEFYKKNSIAPPSEHQIERVRKLIMTSNSAVMEESKCNKCSKELIVAVNDVYRERNIYCKDCYLKYLEQYG
ncbi:MAG: hypothetical protein ABIH21_01795 [Patescibacteria group bacterium]